jgi:hypothetical protein
MKTAWRAYMTLGCVWVFFTNRLTSSVPGPGISLVQLNILRYIKVPEPRISLGHLNMNFVHCIKDLEAGIWKNYSATNSGSPEVELRFCPWLIFFLILNRLAWPELFSLSLLCVSLVMANESRRMNFLTNSIQPSALWYTDENETASRGVASGQPQVTESQVKYTSTELLKI